MKRRLACFGGAFALAELAAAYLPALATLLTAAVFVFAVILYTLRKDLPHRRYLPVLAGAALGLCWAVGYQTAVYAQQQAYAGQTVSCTVIAETDCEPSYQEGMLRGTLRITQLAGQRCDIKAYCTAFPGVEAGECFTATLRLDYLKDDSYRMSHYAKGVYLGAEYLSAYRQTASARTPAFMLLRLRRSLAQKLCIYLPRNLGTLEAAMLLGDKSRLSDAMQATFRAAGVAHLLSVSGLHVALLCGLFSFAVGGNGGKRFSRWRIAVQAVVLLFYMLLTGLPISVVRAGTIFLIALAGHALWQPPDLLTSLGAAALLLGLQNAYAPCDVGFQLSFCGVLGVQTGVALASWENAQLPWLHSPVDSAHRLRSIVITAVQRTVSAVQCAFFATLATLPVLLAHDLTTSGVAVLTNLLVVWMLRYALLLGLPVLLFSAVPLLAPFMHGSSLILGIWLKLMYGITAWCAALPVAHLSLPRRYTLLVLATLAILALIFYYYKKLLYYLPVFAGGVLLAVALGSAAQKGIVTVSLVGTAGSPCVIVQQNGLVAVIFRGGAGNCAAVEDYLTEQGIPEIATAIDLRQQPTDNMVQAAATITMAQMSQGESRVELLDGISAELLHTGGGNAVILDVAGLHIATVAGKVKSSALGAVDLFCAAGAYPTGLLAQAVLYTANDPAWLAAPGSGTALYYGERPCAVIRPGRSFGIEEAKKSVVQ